MIHLGEEGIVVDRRPAGYWVVRFAKGAFLIDSQYIEPVNTPATDQPLPEHVEPVLPPKQHSDEN